MTGRLLFDTNVIVYPLDPKDPSKRTTSLTLIHDALSQQRLVVSPQILNECYSVIVHRRRLAPAAQVARYLSAYHGACTAPLDLDTHRSAVGLEGRHRLSWWDCVAIASARQPNRTHFVSEDLNDGQVIENLIVVNPFASHAFVTLALI